MTKILKNVVWTHMIPTFLYAQTEVQQEKKVWCVSVIHKRKKTLHCENWKGGKWGKTRERDCLCQDKAGQDKSQQAPQQSLQSPPTPRSPAARAPGQP